MSERILHSVEYNPSHTEAEVKAQADRAFGPDGYRLTTSRREWPMAIACARGDSRNVAHGSLFIPLKSEFYDAFLAGTKTTEFRRHGPGWNAKTCTVGRRVVLSKGYGKAHRVAGTIVAFEVSEGPTKSEAWRKCYGDKPGAAACITIRLDGVTP
jgi:hypothetical protein